MLPSSPTTLPWSSLSLCCRKTISHILCFPPNSHTCLHFPSPLPPLPGSLLTSLHSSSRSTDTPNSLLGRRASEIPLPSNQNAPHPYLRGASSFLSFLSSVSAQMSNSQRDFPCNLKTLPLSHSLAYQLVLLAFKHLSTSDTVLSIYFSPPSS